MARSGVAALTLAVVLALFEFATLKEAVAVEKAKQCSSSSEPEEPTLKRKITLNRRYRDDSLSPPPTPQTIQKGSCLRCYQCVSQKDPGCADAAPPKHFIVDCSTQDAVNFNMLYLNSILPREIAGGTIGASKYCHKIVMKSGSVARTCLDANPHNLNLSCELIEKASKLSNNDAVQIKDCKVCDKDECNAAGSLAASLPLAGLALIISYFYTQ